MNYTPVVIGKHDSIKAVMEEHCVHLSFDKKLATAVIRNSFNFANKNDEHISFFTGHHIGVETVRFKPEDRNRFFEDIVLIDDISLRDDILALEQRALQLRETPAIVSTRHVSTDALNLLCLYMIHKFMTSNKLTKEEGHQASIELVMFLQYKFLTSIMATWIHYQAKPEVSEAAYAALSKKFGLKVYGSWGALLRARAESTLAVTGIHYRTIINFDNDFDIVYLINDMQGRIKDIMKNVMDVFMEVSRDSNASFKTLSATVNLDGVSHVRELDRSFPTYKRYLFDTIPDLSSFVKGELVDSICDAINTVPREALIETLKWMSNNFGSPKASEINRLCDLTMNHFFRWVKSSSDITRRMNNMEFIISSLRFIYTSNKTSDEMLLEMRSHGEEIASRATGITRQAALAPIRTAVLLYLVLRTFTKHHYSH